MGKISTSYNSNDNIITIKIIGTFDFEVVKKFRYSYENNAEIKKYFIDLGEVSYIDSRGIGTLLIMQEDINQSHSDAVICITNATDDIKRLFKNINLKQMEPDLMLEYAH